MEAAPLGIVFASPARGVSELRDAVRVIDGDTLKIAGRDMRLWSGNTPEIANKGGRAARDQLEKIVAGRAVVRCGLKHRGAIARFAGRCRATECETIYANLKTWREYIDAWFTEVVKPNS